MYVGIQREGKKKKYTERANGCLPYVSLRSLHLIFFLYYLSIRQNEKWKFSN